MHADIADYPRFGRYVVDAVLLEGRSAREVARTPGISKTWIYELIKRYRAGRIRGARATRAVASMVARLRDNGRR
jgi:transposase